MHPFRKPSDIDLVVLSPSMPSPPAKPSSSLLHRLASLLLTSSLAEPSSLLVIAKARVPIVKFVTRYGGFSVDISVNQKGGVDAAMRVRNLLEQHASRDQDWVEPGVPQKGKGKGKGREIEQEEEKEAAEPVDYGVARSLVLMVKAFLNQRGMNEVFTGGLGSYSIICLVISFLQVRPLLLPSFSCLLLANAALLPAPPEDPDRPDPPRAQHWPPLRRIPRVLREALQLQRSGDLDQGPRRLLQQAQQGVVPSQPALPPQYRRPQRPQSVPFLFVLSFRRKLIP